MPAICNKSKCKMNIRITTGRWKSVFLKTYKNSTVSSEKQNKKNPKPQLNGPGVKDHWPTVLVCCKTCSGGLLLSVALKQTDNYTALMEGGIGVGRFYKAKL